MGKLLREMAERGEHAKAGDNQHGGSRAARLSDLGITKGAVSGARAEFCHRHAPQLRRHKQVTPTQ